MGFPGDSVGKESACSAGDAGDSGSIPGSGRSPGGGHGNPFPVFLPGDSHGQRSLVGYSPWGHKEQDTTEMTGHTHHRKYLRNYLLSPLHFHYYYYFYH